MTSWSHHISEESNSTTTIRSTRFGYLIGTRLYNIHKIKNQSFWACLNINPTFAFDRTINEFSNGWLLASTTTRHAGDWTSLSEDSWYTLSLIGDDDVAEWRKKKYF